MLINWLTILNLNSSLQATLLPFFGLPPPLDRSRPLVVPELALEFSDPPSRSCLGWLIS